MRYPKILHTLHPDPGRWPMAFNSLRASCLACQAVSGVHPFWYLELWLEVGGSRRLPSLRSCSLEAGGNPQGERSAAVHHARRELRGILMPFWWIGGAFGWNGYQK